MSIFKWIDGFFFARMSATGLGLMRIAWAATVLITLLSQWTDITFFYDDSGAFSPTIIGTIFRREYHYSILSFVHTPQTLWFVYIFFLISVTAMLVGLWPRLSTVISVLLLFSFHERSPFILGGGDTLLRNIGFILMLAPGIESCSLSKIFAQIKTFQQTRKLANPSTSPSWPYRLLLWQMIVLYTTSLWSKLLGSMWTNGTAIQAVLHHTTFIRFPVSAMDVLMPIAPFIGWLLLVWEASWLLLLVPLPRIPLKRILIGLGLFFHGLILVLMDAGNFSLAIFTAYLGLLRDEDFEWLRGNEQRATSQRVNIVVLYDGNCGLCLRSIAVLLALDALHRLEPVDFRDAKLRKKFAPDVTEKELNKALHIKLPTGEYEKGFDAFRVLSWHLPALWIFAPCLYIPGIPPIGRIVYTNIANRRRKCTHATCAI